MKTEIDWKSEYRPGTVGDTYVKQKEAEALIGELADAVDMLMRAHEAAMPGLKHIAVQDYALQNDARVAGRRVLAKVQAQR